MADATAEFGYKKLLSDIKTYYPLQWGHSAKFEWVSPDLLKNVLERTGFSVKFFELGKRDVFLVATLTDISNASELETALQ